MCVLPICIGSAGVPVRGVSRQGTDVNVFARTRHQLSHTGHRDHYVACQPPPPIIPPLLHAGAIGGPKQPPSQHRSVCKGGIDELEHVGGRGGQGGHREGLLVIFLTDFQSDSL